MTKKQEPEAPPVPGLSLDPPAGPLESLPGPQAPGADEAPEEKKRRRRRKKTEPEQAVTPEGVATPEDLERCAAALAATFEIGGKILAKRRGPHWQLDQEEAATLGQVWTSALAPYLPQIGAAVPWAAALAVTWSMVQPRIQQDAELAAANDPQKQASGPALA